MKTGLIIAVSVLMGVSILLLFLKLIMHLLRQKLENEIKAGFRPEDIIGATTHTSFFGRHSKGGRQIRGNGALILTREALIFKMALPSRTYAIPIKLITGVSTPESFCGKTVGSKLLSVNFEKDGQEDAMAWAVKSPEKWQIAITELIGLKA